MLTWDQIYKIAEFSRGRKGWGDGCLDCLYEDGGDDQYHCALNAYDLPYGTAYNHGCKKWCPSKECLKKNLMGDEEFEWSGNLQ